MTQPLDLYLVDAARAHQDGVVRYEDDGTVVLRDPAAALDERIAPSRQFPLVRATFEDLNKALSRLASSPTVEGERTLRAAYDDELARYEQLAGEAYEAGRWEPDYGTYVFERRDHSLYLVAPEAWHRLALVTSNAMLLTDPKYALSWHQVRAKLEGAVLGFAGLSVGGNLLEGWLREARPKQVKLADPDWIEITNFNRGERMSLRHVSASRAARFDPRNPYETIRVSKAGYIAYEQRLVDPYLTTHLYREGITRQNIDRFLLGDGKTEPRIDILVEEMDNLDLKIAVREQCRKHGIDVLMLSDFGHHAHAMWNWFSIDPQSPIPYTGSDEALMEILAGAKAGDRTKLFDFIAAMCGEPYATDQFERWIAGTGEQPTGSIPQSGGTAMASGAIGGKELALAVLGYHKGGPRRVIYDLLHRSARVG